MAEQDAWYWCLRHQQVENRVACRGSDRMGPYASREDAENWRQRVETRNDRWDKADERWRGDR